MYALVVVEGPDSGARHPLPDREPQLIGRSTEAIPLRDDSVSRRHAELTPDEGRWWLRDLDSTNGTFINDIPTLDRTALDPGDRIRCGDTVLVFAHLDEADIHGRLRAPDPATHSVRLLNLDSQPATTGMEVLSGKDFPSLSLMATVLSQGLRADAVAILPIDGRGGLRGLAEIRNEAGEPPNGSFNLPRELISATVSMAEGRPQIAILDEIEAVAAISVGVDRHRYLIAAVRPHQRPWTSDDLLQLTHAARLVGLRLMLKDGVSDAARLERLAAMGEATAALSHSIKNILQGMRGGADAIELALARDRADLARKGWSILARNLDRILALSLNMLAYSKDRSLDPMPTVLGSLATEAIEAIQPAAERRNVEVEYRDSGTEPPVPIDPDAIHQVILNLLGNAVEAVETGGRVQVRTRYQPEKDEIVLEVADDGPGVPIDRQERIFEPFYSTKGQRGTGLGLAVAKKLVLQHGGSLELLKDDGLGGAMFRVVLPTSWDGDSDASDTRGPNPIQDGELGIRFET
ncbi:MAG: hypothetical protein CMJ23_03740 [Phycisphaerae bacterium]|nr:hypothetical protein [Phycisphaerae bacterium]